MSNKQKGPDLEKFQVDVEKIALAVNKMIDGEKLEQLILRGQSTTFYEGFTKMLITSFTTHLYGTGKEKLDVDVKFFDSWWDHTKARWFPKWVLRFLRLKVNLTHHKHDQEIFQNVCPHLGDERRECFSFLAKGSEE